MGVMGLCVAVQHTPSLVTAFKRRVGILAATLYSAFLHFFLIKQLCEERWLTLHPCAAAWCLYGMHTHTRVFICVCLRWLTFAD